MKKNIIIILLLSAVNIYGQWTDENYRYLTIGHNGTAATPQTGVVLNWHTDSSTTGTPQIWLTKTSTFLASGFGAGDTIAISGISKDTIKYTCPRTLNYTNPANYIAVNYVINHLRVSGLQKDTAYTYWIKIGAVSDVWYGSDTANFKTPSDTPVCLAISDFQNAYTGRIQADITNLMASNNLPSSFDLVLDGGDNLLYGEEYGNWAEWLYGYDSLMAYNIVAPNFGDHDTRYFSTAGDDSSLTNYRAFFDLPDDGVLNSAHYAEANYTFTLGRYNFINSMWAGEPYSLAADGDSILYYIQQNIDPTKFNTVIYQGNFARHPAYLQQYYANNVDLVLIGDLHYEAKLWVGCFGYGLAVSNSSGHVMKELLFDLWDATDGVHHYETWNVGSATDNRKATLIEFGPYQVKVTKVHIILDEVLDTFYIR